MHSAFGCMPCINIELLAFNSISRCYFWQCTVLLINCLCCDVLLSILCFVIFLQISTLVNSTFSPSLSVSITFKQFGSYISK